MRRHIGLEVAASAIRVVEIQKKIDSNGFVTLKKVAIEPFPEESPVTLGKIEDRTTVAHAMREALSSAGLPRRGIVVGIAADSLAAYLEVPAGAKDHEREFLIRNADLSMWDTLDKENDRISWRVVESFTNGEGLPREILAVAAVKSETINRLEETLDLAQIRPAAVDLSGAALVRSLVRVQPSDRTTQTIVDVGAQQTLVVTRVGAHPRDIRTVAHGGDVVTDAVARASKLNPISAEEQKRHMEIPRTEGLNMPLGSIPGMSPTSLEPLSEVEEALTTAADELISSIANVVDQDTALNPSEPTQGVLLVGGGSRLRGIRERVAARLGVPVHLGQPWVADKFTKQTRFLEGNRRQLADLAVPVGLAMWGMIDRPSTDRQ